MRAISKLFTKHPDTVGETYLQHMAASLGFSLRLFGASLACLVHALFPFWHVSTGSRTISQLHSSMVTHRDQRSERQATDPLLASEN